ncbi:MAG: Type 1 glutamine amidotransferase-like domain-containing protein [Clostridiales bacterium]|nr:Type 1 glutamine amidotransferase-like domain-containing protein [Clostridiales bacterium]
MSGGGRETPAYLLAGGRPQSEDSMSRMLTQAYGDTPKPRVAYIGTANGDNPAFYAMMKLLLMKAGAKQVANVRLAKEKADVAKAKKALESADVIFLSGGEVEDGMIWLKKHGLVEYLRELYRQGKQFVGVSAGTIMLGEYWVRWEDEDDDDTASLFTCLGFVPATFDVHGEGEDWKELKTALKLMGHGARGYGVPRGGMVSGDSRGELVNMEKSLLTFVNDNGQIRLEQ